MPGPHQSTRVIYAKLTSTGAYDVVAKTASIDLPAARELAEKVQLGNLPFGVKIGEELGYARPEAGGHLVARYTTYGWNDGRPAPPMTDLVWVDDATFEAVRRNPFALIPHSNDIYAELTELSPVVVAPVDAESEWNRLRELAPSATDFTSFVAGVLGSESLLLVATPNVAVHLELLLLLLPPRLRDRITFQTCAYQPPQLRRRVTAADAMHANLRQVAWTRVLPDQADTLTLNPANRFTEYLTAPERLRRAHALYERIDVRDVASALALEAARLVRLADFLGLVDNKLITEALRLMARASGSEAVLELAELEARFSHSAIAEAMVALFETGGDEDALVRALEGAHGAAAEAYHDALGKAALSARREPAPELGKLLLRHAAQVGDADRAVGLQALLRAGASAGALAHLSGVPAPIARYLEALGTRNRKRPLAAAIGMLQAATELVGSLRTRDARHQIELDFGAALEEVTRSITLSAADVRDLRALQATFDAVAQQWNGKYAALLLTDAYVRRADSDELLQSAESVGRSASAEWAGALCATMLLRIADSSDAELRNRLAAAAHAILNAHPDRRVGARMAALLPEAGVRDGELLAEPAFAAVLPFLGDSAREASLAQTLGSALTRLYGDGAGAAAELAAAVFSARINQQVIALGSRAHAAVITALRNARERGLVSSHPVQTELALDLLAFAAEAAAFRQIEDAALGRSDAIGIRLRRLDRAIEQSTTAQDEQLYSALADVLETSGGGLDAAARQRLRQALGTTGVHRRIMEAFNSVIQRPSS